MKRYQFRLANVLRLRRAEEEQAKLALAAANTDLRRCLIARDRTARTVRNLAQRVEADRIEELLAERYDAALATERLAAEERLVAEAAAQAAMAQVTWISAHRRVLALERLDERRRGEHEAELRREEAAVIDDLVTARFVPSAAGGLR